MSFEGIMKKRTKKVMGYVLGHALLFGILGLIIFTTTYYLILSLRVKLGYFNFPILTTLSEVNWYFIGVSFVLVATGIGAVKGYHKSKKK